LALKEKADSPENITADNIEKSLGFLNDKEILENFLREKTRKESLFEKTVQDKLALEAELQNYKDREAEIENQRKELELESSKNEFANQQWKLNTKENISDLLYYIMVTLITILPIAVGLLLKVITALNNWIISIGNYQYIIWAILIVLFVCELLGRSYLFDKAKVKRGFDFMKLFLSFKYSKYKNEKLSEFKDCFQS